MGTIKIVRDPEEQEAEGTSLSNLLREYVQTQKTIAQAQNHLKDLRSQIIEFMTEHSSKTLSLTRDGITHRLTYVKNTRFVVNEQGLRKALTAKVYDKYTDKKLNRKLLEEAMEKGEIDPKAVLPYVEEKPGEPYLRYTEAEAKDDE